MKFILIARNTNEDMEMNVHARKFAVYSMAEEQFVADDKNNNLKNDQIIEKQQTVIQTTNKKIDLQIDELRLKYQNNDEQMEKHSIDMRSSDLVGSTKSSTALNFSVDSILSSTNSLKKNDTEIVDHKTVSSQHLISGEDYRIYRPMPMRYLSNPQLLQGFPMSNSPLPLPMHRHLKYPISNFHCGSLNPSPFPPNLAVDRFLLPNPVSFPHFQNPHHHTERFVDPTNPKITSIPPPNASSLGGSPSLSQSKRKRSWSRAVFSQLQRKGLEIQFQIQKYITKPDRRKLAARLGLTDAQVKVWFQNRRMKWRHSKLETKGDKSRTTKTENKDDDDGIPVGSSAESDSCSSGDEHEIEIDIEAE